MLTSSCSSAVQLCTGLRILMIECGASQAQAEGVGMAMRCCCCATYAYTNIGALDRYSQADQLCATFSQKCSDVAFCKRLRGQKGEVYAVQADTLAVEDSKLTARVVNEANAAEFVLTLTAYKDVIRLHIDEDASKGRFQERQDPGHPICQQYASLTWGGVLVNGVLVKEIIGDHHH